jgi:hypothetical protein
MYLCRGGYEHLYLYFTLNIISREIRTLAESSATYQMFLSNDILSHQRCRYQKGD